jgi:hypothetical protein
VWLAWAESFARRMHWGPSTINALTSYPEHTVQMIAITTNDTKVLHAKTFLSANSFLFYLQMCRLAMQVEICLLIYSILVDSHCCISKSRMRFSGFPSQNVVRVLLIDTFVGHLVIALDVHDRRHVCLPAVNDEVHRRNDECPAQHSAGPVHSHSRYRRCQGPTDEEDQRNQKQQCSDVDGHAEAAKGPAPRRKCACRAAIDDASDGEEV